MIGAHATVFHLLDAFCADHSNPINNAGKVRWTGGSPGIDKELLRHAKLVLSMSFSDSTKIARFDHNQISYFFTIGLDLPDEIDLMEEVEVGGNMLTLILSELQPCPAQSVLEIRNVVEAEDKSSTADYAGHDSTLIANLFPPIRCFSIEELAHEETARMFFVLCLSSLSGGARWMKPRLRHTLKSITELSPVAIPYQTLCRSVFDTDPSSVFLALYRCLEAVYAYSHATKLKNRLGIQDHWSDVAVALEEILSWHPREEPSLGALLQHAVVDDLQRIFQALGEPVPNKSEILARATKRIYSLRNALVHYRPFHQSLPWDNIDWNLLCEATAALVLDISEEVKTSE